MKCPFGDGGNEKASGDYSGRQRAEEVRAGYVSEMGHVLEFLGTGATFFTIAR